MRRTGNEGPQMMDGNRAKTDAEPRFQSPALTVNPMIPTSHVSFQRAPLCSTLLPELGRGVEVGKDRWLIAVNPRGKLPDGAPDSPCDAGFYWWNKPCNAPFTASPNDDRRWTRRSGETAMQRNHARAASHGTISRFWLTLRIWWWWLRPTTASGRTPAPPSDGSMRHSCYDADE